MPNSMLENSKTSDSDKSDTTSLAETDSQSDISASLYSDDRIAVAETVSSLVDTVHSQSSDEEKDENTLQNDSVSRHFEFHLVFFPIA